MNELSKFRRDLRESPVYWVLTQPSYLAVFNFRLAGYLYRNKILKIFYLLYAPVWRIIALATGIEISARTNIGPGLKIVHYGQVFINSLSIIGDNCTLYNGVTVGVKHYGDTKAPRIGNNVEIGAGAKIIGDITIGDNCQIGANAVVTKSFPANQVIVGIPAKSIGTVKK